MVLVMRQAMSKAGGALSWLSLIFMALGAIWLSIQVVWDAVIGDVDWRWQWFCRAGTLLYGTWMWYDWDRPCNGTVERNPMVVKLMSPLLRGARSYFPARIINDCKEQLAGKGPVMLCCHPHGIWGMGVLANFAFDYEATQLGRPIYVLTLDLHFYIPLWRDLCLALGFASVSRRSLRSLLEKGKSVAVVLGGAREALDARPGVMEVMVRRRRGFFRVALQHGVPIRPVLTFGEVDLFDQLRGHRWVRRIQEALLKHLSFSTPIFWGRYGLLPAPRPLISVIGAPLVTSERAPKEHESSISDEAITEAQEEYIRLLTDLHCKFNTSLGPTKLIIK